MDNTFYKQIEIFDKRFRSLEKHYDKVQSQNKKLDKELEQNVNLKDSIEDRMRKRVEEIDELYSAKVKECKAKCELFQQMYKAREEEHKRLEDYINNYELEKKPEICFGRQHDGAFKKHLSIIQSDKIKEFRDKYNKLRTFNEQISRDHDQCMKVLKMSRESGKINAFPLYWLMLIA